MSVLASTRGRLAVLAAVLVVAAVLAGGAFARAVQDQRERQRPTAATAKDTALDLGAVLDAPHIVVRSTAAGPTYGRLAAVPLADPGGARSVSDLSCDRVAAAGAAGMCLQAERGAVTTYHGRVLDARMRPVAELPVNGIPSRTRVSADGSRVAMTVFVSDHGYGTIGFSTQTVIYDRSGLRGYGDMEKDWTTLIDGRRVTAADLNVWGITFDPVPEPTGFYATVATGGRTWLVRGDLAARTLTALRADAECPSLSPDGTRVVYKKRAGAPTRWRYHVLDLRTGVERPLAETRSIDDQAEWLDADHVLYGLLRAGTAESDVWVADVRTGAPPKVLIPDAWSPTVVRTAATVREPSTTRG